MTRKLSAIGLLICIASLGAAYYLEYEYMLAVCPLCILQRIVFYALGFTFLSGVVFNFKKALHHIYASTISFLSVVGMLLATRQIWLQYFAPPQEISCSASLERLMQIYPMFEALKIALIGSGECAEIDFSILGLSLAVWSFIIFLVLLITGIALFRKR